nr:hypothetical protein [Mycoplasmopsis bovis]
MILGKVQVAETKDKSNQAKKLKLLSKKLLLQKVPTLKDKELKLNAWFKQEKRNCFC